MGRSDAELLVAASEGSQEAFAEFFRQHVRAVTGFAIRRCTTADDVADAVSDTFLVALQAAGRYRPENDTALPWLMGITRRIILRQRRSISRRLGLHARLIGHELHYTASEESAIADAIDAARQVPSIERALARLPEGEREALELVAYDGLRPSEAAVVLGVTPNAVRLRLSRARRKMQKWLEPERHVPIELRLEAPRA